LKALVVSVGNEIISGHITDTNAAWISDRLESMGVDVVMHLAVADDEAVLIEELRRASRAVDLILVTGGLGPTRDDITRQAVAAAAGGELELHEPTLERIRERFRRYGYGEMPRANRIQACIPAGAEIIPNENGTAAGIRIKLNRAQVFAMPGVPPEMSAMFERSVAPFIRSLAGDGVHICGTLECFGTSESIINRKIQDLMDPAAEPQVGLLANSGQITVKIIARAEDEDTAGEVISRTKCEIRRRLGDIIIGEDGEQLEEIVGRLLSERSLSIATAESCTGGLIAAKITNVPGSSGYFRRGYVTYSNDAKTDMLGVPRGLFSTVGAVSEEVAQAMAEGAVHAAGAEVAVATTGIAGPDGGSEEKPVGLVYIAVADRHGAEVQHRQFSGDRAFIRERTARVALNLVRRRLLVQE